jgi:hypothetical protein
LNVLEFVKKYLKVLEFFLLYFMVFSKIIWHSKTDILLIWFCMIISDKAVWNSLNLRFEQFNVTLYWFLTPSFQCLVLEFADTWPWKVLEFDSFWYVRTLYNLY